MTMVSMILEMPGFKSKRYFAKESRASIVNLSFLRGKPKFDSSTYCMGKEI